MRLPQGFDFVKQLHQQTEGLGDQAAGLFFKGYKVAMVIVVSCP
jgi:hypothetical protein